MVFSISAGTLPLWASLNSSTGTISGTSDNVADTNVTISCESADGQQASLEITISIMEVVPELQAPVNTSMPTISGNTSIGSLLTCTSDGTWTGYPVPELNSRQWLRDGAEISDATDETYTTVDDDAELDIACRVTYSNSEGSASATSNSIVMDAVPEEPVLSIFGFDNISDPGVGSDDFSSDRLLVASFTKTSGPIVSIHAHVTNKNNTPGGQFRVACYSDGIGKPGSLLWASDVSTAESVPTSLTFNCDDTSSSDDAGTYWLGVTTMSGYDNQFYYVLPAAGSRYGITTNSDAQNLPLTWPDETLNGAFDDCALLVWCEYEEVPSYVPVNTVAPHVSGESLVDSTITCTTGTWTNDPEGYTYQWRKDDADITDATDSSYALQLEDVGTYIGCRVTATNSFGSASAYSDNTILVTDDEEPGEENAAPTNVVAPTVTGTSVEGNVLTCALGTWTGIPEPTYTYQWRRDDIDIEGETDSTYTSLDTDVGSVISCRVTATNSEGSESVTTSGRTIVALADLNLELDLSYVVQSGSRWTAFIDFVDAELGGSSPYGFSAYDAIYAYRITGNTDYRTLAIDTIEEQVVAAELAITEGSGRPEVAGDSYLYAGEHIGPLAMAYQWFYDQLSGDQRSRWAAYADQTIYNIWNPSIAEWGGVSQTWSGWAVNDPGNNYYYSFTTATAFWALASSNAEMLEFVDSNKFTPLRSYMSAITGGGSREGTGYGVSFMNLFDLYQVWEDSNQSALANANRHLTDTGLYWLHATMPTLDTYCPIGDLARESYPNLFDYHRHLVLQVHRITDDSDVRDQVSWWLNNISVQSMSQGTQRKYNLLPPGSNTSSPPTTLNYYGSGTGVVFGRNSWEEDATFCHFLAGIYDQSHAAQQQGSFVLFNSSFRTVSGNIWSHSGIRQDVEYNNVLCFRTSGNTVIEQNTGTATNAVELESDGSFNAIANLKPIVSNATVTSWSREATFNAPLHQLRIQDSFATTSGTTATFQFVVPTSPTIEGNVVTCGDLRATIVVPGSPTVTSTALSDIPDSDVSQGHRVDISGASTEFDVLFEIISKQDATLPANTVAPSVTGDNEVGATLTSTQGTWTNDPSSYSYQWRRAGSNIGGATGDTYVAQSSDIGLVITCAVTATNDSGSITASSNGITIAGAPTNDVAPEVTGSTALGSTLTTTNGTWIAYPTPTYTYQWQYDDAGWVNIVDQTESTLDTSGMDVGDYRCVVTATNDNGNDSAASNTVAMTEEGGGEGGDPASFGWDPGTNDIEGVDADTRCWMAKFVKTSSGTVDGVFARMASSSGAGDLVKILCYSDNAGAPDQLIWSTTGQVIPGPGVMTFDVPADVSGTYPAGTYHLGVVGNPSSYNGKIIYGDGIGLELAYEGMDYNSPAATWPTIDNTEYDGLSVAIWCTYNS